MNRDLVFIHNSDENGFDTICTMTTSFRKTDEVTADALNELLNASEQFRFVISDYFSMILDDAEITEFEAVHGEPGTFMIVAAGETRDDIFVQVDIAIRIG